MTFDISATLSCGNFKAYVSTSKSKPIILFFFNIAVSLAILVKRLNWAKLFAKV